MRIVAIYDIHGNLPALEAVLQEIGNEAVDAIVVGGDVVAGPMPSETLTCLQNIDIPTHFIHGNAESELLRYLVNGEPSGLSEQADDIARWVAQTLTSEHQQFVAQWPMTLELDVDGFGTMLFCHATPHNDIDVFTRLTPDEKLIPLFEKLNVSLVVCGHTHMQFDRTIAGVRVVNAGSVGMPFGRIGADWLLIETDVVFRHTDYDTIAAAEHIRQSGYPGAEEFAANNILESPSEELALQMLSQLEAQQAGQG